MEYKGPVGTPLNNKDYVAPKIRLNKIIRRLSLLANFIKHENERLSREQHPPESVPIPTLKTYKPKFEQERQLIDLFSKSKKKRKKIKKSTQKVMDNLDKYDTGFGVYAPRHMFKKKKTGAKKHDAALNILLDKYISRLGTFAPYEPVPTDDPDIFNDIQVLKKNSFITPKSTEENDSKGNEVDAPKTTTETKESPKGIETSPKSENAEGKDKQSEGLISAQSKWSPESFETFPRSEIAEKNEGLIPASSRDAVKRNEATSRSDFNAMNKDLSKYKKSKGLTPAQSKGTRKGFKKISNLSKGKQAEGLIPAQSKGTLESDEASTQSEIDEIEYDLTQGKEYEAEGKGNETSPTSEIAEGLLQPKDIDALSPAQRAEYMKSMKSGQPIIVSKKGKKSRRPVPKSSMPPLTEDNFRKSEGSFDNWIRRYLTEGTRKHDLPRRKLRNSASRDSNTSTYSRGSHRMFRRNLFRVSKLRDHPSYILSIVPPVSMNKPHSRPRDSLYLNKSGKMETLNLDENEPDINDMSDYSSDSDVPQSRAQKSPRPKRHSAEPSLDWKKARYKMLLEKRKATQIKIDEIMKNVQIIDIKRVKPPRNFLEEAIKRVWKPRIPLTPTAIKTVRNIKYPTKLEVVQLPEDLAKTKPIHIRRYCFKKPMKTKETETVTPGQDSCVACCLLAMAKGKPIASVKEVSEKLSHSYKMCC